METGPRAAGRFVMHCIYDGCALIGRFLTSKIGALTSNHGALTTKNGVGTTKNGMLLAKNGPPTSKHGALLSKNRQFATNHGWLTSKKMAFATKRGTLTSKHGKLRLRHWEAASGWLGGAWHFVQVRAFCQRPQRGKTAPAWRYGTHALSHGAGTSPLQPASRGPAAQRRTRRSYKPCTCRAMAAQLNFSSARFRPAWPKRARFSGSAMSSLIRAARSREN